MLDNSYDKIVQLTQLRVKEAQAFLLMLGVVRGEIKPGAALPASTPIGTPEMYHTAAYAVERETEVFKNGRRFDTALTPVSYTHLNVGRTFLGFTGSCAQV